MTMRRASQAAIAAMFALLIWRLWQFLGVSAHALSYPFELDYGEGIVWQQANMMFTPEAFGSIDGFPAIVFHYTPLFHVMTRLVSWLFSADMLYAGRAVSIGSTLLIAFFVGLVAARTIRGEGTGPVAAVTGLAAGLIIFLLWPLLAWAPMMRVDMLAFMLSFLGTWCALKAYQQPVYIFWAALAFVAAVYSKQTSLAAPAAAFLVMLWLRPKLAIKGIGACIIIGLAALFVLNAITDGGFFRHIFLYNINRFEWSRLWMVQNTLFVHGPIFGVAAIFALRRVFEFQARRSGQPRADIADDPVDVALLTLLAFFVTSTLMLVTIAKSGSSVNYLIEWLLVAAALAGCGLGDGARLAFGTERIAEPSLTLILLPIAIAAQAWLLKPPDFEMFWQRPRIAQLEQLSALIKTSDKPIISDEMVILLRSGKPVLWEPAIFAELGSKGVWDEKPFVSRVKAQQFAMFITVGNRGSRLFDSRYNPAVADAVDAAYPVKRNYAGYTVHLPRLAEANLPAARANAAAVH